MIQSPFRQAQSCDILKESKTTGGKLNQLLNSEQNNSFVGMELGKQSLGLNKRNSEQFNLQMNNSKLSQSFESIRENSSLRKFDNSSNKENISANLQQNFSAKENTISKRVQFSENKIQENQNDKNIGKIDQRKFQAQQQFYSENKQLQNQFKQSQNQNNIYGSQNHKLSLSQQDIHLENNETINKSELILGINWDDPFWNYFKKIIFLLFAILIFYLCTSRYPFEIPDYSKEKTQGWVQKNYNNQNNNNNNQNLDQYIEKKTQQQTEEIVKDLILFIDQRIDLIDTGIKYSELLIRSSYQFKIQDWEMVLEKLEESIKNYFPEWESTNQINEYGQIDIENKIIRKKHVKKTN